MKPLLWLALGCGVPGLVASAMCVSGVWQVPWIVPAAATLLVLVPGMLVLAVLEGLKHRSPEERIVYLLCGTFFRMGVAIGGGILVCFLVPDVREYATAFSVFALILYLVGLAVETISTVRPLMGSRNNNTTGV